MQNQKINCWLQSDTVLLEDQNFKTLIRYSVCLADAVECLRHNHPNTSKFMAKASKCLEKSEDAKGIHDEMMIFANCFEKGFNLPCLRTHN